MARTTPLPSGIPPELDRILQRLRKLPGVGEGTAQKYALHLVHCPEDARTLGAELAELSTLVGFCAECNGLTRFGEVCDICSDTKRSASALCVVHKVQDVIAFERVGMGLRYFVLGKLLSPLEGIGIDEVPIAALTRRVHAMVEVALASNGARTEVVIATPTSVDGDATAIAIADFLTRAIAPENMPQITRIQTGIGHGAEINYADTVTLTGALRGRREFAVRKF